MFEFFIDLASAIIGISIGVILACGAIGAVLILWSVFKIA